MLVSLNLDNNGRLRDDPEIITRGFVYKHEAQELIEATSQHIIETIDNLDGDIHNSMVKAVRSFLYKETKRRPMVFVTLNWS